MNKILKSIIYLFLLLCISCSAPSLYVKTQNRLQDELSLEIEKSNYISSVKEDKTYKDTCNVIVQDVKSSSPSVTITKKQQSRKVKNRNTISSITLPVKNSIITSHLDDAPAKNRNDKNGIWKVGFGILEAGFVLLVVCGALLFKTDRDDAGLLLLTGLLIGLILMIVSLPLLLIGWIIGKRQKNKTIDKPAEETKN